MNSANFSYFCRTCNVTTNAEDTDNIRTRSRLQMPEGVNTNPLASTKFPYTVNKQLQEIRGIFKTLQNKGMRIRNYRDEVKG